MRRLRQSAIGIGLVLYGVSCGHPQVLTPSPADLLELSNSAVQIELPEEVAHWQRPLQDDLEQLVDLLEIQLERWPAVKTVASLRLVCTLRGPLATQYAHQHRLAGDPQVPRTHRQQRLAVIPLPRLDQLLTKRTLPPRTLRETIRHELVHLLCLDRPALRDAPLWFHEGLAEAWVGLRPCEFPGPETHALGLSWLQELRERAAAEPDLEFEIVAQSLPAELRYQAWAALVTRLLSIDDSQQPWLGAMDDLSVSEFIRHYEELNPSSHPPLLGRDADFFPSGKSVLLVSAPSETVALELADWTGSSALELAARTGRSGATLGEVLLGPPDSAMCLRIRQNQDGAWIAAWEHRSIAEKRSLRDRLPGAQANRWRQWRLSFEERPDGLIRICARSGAETFVQDLAVEMAPSVARPWTIRAQVTDGAFELSSDAPLRPALR